MSDRNDEIDEMLTTAGNVLLNLGCIINLNRGSMPISKRTQLTDRVNGLYEKIVGAVENDDDQDPYAMMEVAVYLALKAHFTCIANDDDYARTADQVAAALGAFMAKRSAPQAPAEKEDAYVPSARDDPSVR